MKKTLSSTVKIAGKISAAALSMGLVFTLMPVHAFASPDDPDGGILPPENPPVVEEESEGPYYSSLLDTIGATESGTIEYSEGDSLPLEIIQEMLNKPSLTLKFTYTLEDGTQGTVTVTSEGAATLISTKVVPWYGYMFLEQYIGSAAAMQAITEYTIQPGDTLNGIAKKFGTTVDAIMAENSYITNPDKIVATKKLSISNAVSLSSKALGNSIEAEGKLALNRNALTAEGANVKLENETEGKINKQLGD